MHTLAVFLQLAIAQPDLDFFEKKIRPVLVEQCYSCHSAEGKQRGGLRVDTREALLQGGDSGPALVPGKKDSLLLHALRHDEGGLRMPPKGKLPAAVLADFERWVLMGAPDPRTNKAVTKGGDKTPVVNNHWAFRPLLKPPVPAVKDEGWPISDIDRFILAELEKKQLKPVKPASALQLLRRITFDLTGLPPNMKDVTSWVNAPVSLDKVAALVDQLLDSPEFGERWARHWFDVARYADSTGGGANWVMDDAWRYRDWVIDAFNRDLPYNQFIIEQIAGDLLPGKTEAERRSSIIATGFLMMGPKELAEYDVEKLRMEIVDEQLDTLGRAFLGLTIGCARCHDHKFDPIPTREYHALAGIFRSTTVLGPDKAGPISQVQRRILPASASQTKLAQAALEKLKTARSELTKLQGEMKKLRGIPSTDPKKLDAMKGQIEALGTEVADLQVEADRLGPKAMAVAEDPNPRDLPIFIRGDLNNKGPLVPRGFLQTAFKVPSEKVPAKQSGRLELAHWIAAPENSLTSRVIVNRVWHWLMGEGIVSSVDQFGLRGDAPSHPELLDYLAVRFQEQGWSIKKLIRSIMLSKVYLLSSQHDVACATVDPENRLLWRHERRRLEAEEIRDAILAISGDLDDKRGGATNVNTGRLGFEGLNQKTSTDPRRRRSVYLPMYRGGYVPELFQVFDFPDSGLITGRRNVTTIASQALFLMNSKFLHEQSELAAKRLRGRSETKPNQLYWLVLNRNATPAEAKRTLEFVEDYQTAWAARNLSEGPTPEVAAWTALCHTLFASNEFLFVE